MKLKIFVLLVLTGFLSQAQNKVSISLMGGGNYFFVPDSLNLEKNKEGKIAYNSGLIASLRIFKGLRIETGAIYSKFSFTKKRISFFVYGEDPTLEAQVDYKLWSFPLFLRYDYNLNNKITFFAKGGMSLGKVKSETGTLLSTTPAEYFNSAPTRYDYVLKAPYLFIRNMYSVNFAVGAEYNLYKSLWVGLYSEIQRYYYFDFNKDRSNYVANVNLTISLKL